MPRFHASTHSASSRAAFHLGAAVAGLVAIGALLAAGAIATEPELAHVDTGIPAAQPAPTLAPAWRWERAPVRFDGMIRDSGRSAGGDWIRDSRP